MTQSAPDGRPGDHTGAQPAARLDLSMEPGSLTAALCDIPSVSGSEREIADAVQEALTVLGHLSVVRDGDAVVARTDLGHPERVVLAGHLDTVPIHENLPSRVQGSRLLGCGSCDMKSGVAIQLALAAAIPAPNRDVTYVFYDNEEVEAERNGLGRIARQHPEWLTADFAILLEPSGAVVEGGCQGTMRVEVRTHGTRAHSARSWKGENAIHAAGIVLDRLGHYQAAVVEIDGLTYREGLNAVGISGGVAGNVIPDLCTVTVNFRFAPSRSVAEAEAHVHAVFDGFEVAVVDVAPGALPGLTQPAAAAFIAAVGGQPRAKLGWTDVARFSAVGVPAVNYGPGDPSVAHMREEYVDLPAIRDCYYRLHRWLTA